MTRQTGQVLYDQTVTVNGAGNVNTPAIDTIDYTNLQLFVVLGGGAILAGTTFQTDLIDILPDGTQLDVFNNGTHTSSYVNDIGPGLQASRLVGERSAFNTSVVWGTGQTAVTVRTVVIGYN